MVLFPKNNNFNLNNQLPSVPSGCESVRIRKNVNKLSGAEKERFVNAMQALIDAGSYEKLASLHSGPKNLICPETQTGRGVFR